MIYSVNVKHTLLCELSALKPHGKQDNNPNPVVLTSDLQIFLAWKWLWEIRTNTQDQHLSKTTLVSGFDQNVSIWGFWYIHAKAQ